MKRTMIKLITVLLATILITGTFIVPTSAGTSSKTCFKSGCNRARAKGSIYCSTHASKNTKKETPCYVTGCKRKKRADSSYCDYHYNQKYGKKNSGSAKKPSSKKSYDMPDPDDYEDYDDFMDDWDGCMPDDSDAEDYYDNW